MFKHALRAWGSILGGRTPSLSIEVTKECPLRCPGCYAYEPDHLGASLGLRQLSDFKKDQLVEKILDLVDELRPLHVSLVGGDPLVRFREMEQVIPALIARGIHVQLVTSAFRPIPVSWATMPKLNVAVSIDGLPQDHNRRRAPATYERILSNIQGARITVHCTITAQMMDRAGYLREFVDFWSHRPEVARIWMSLFTPQRGAAPAECLTTEQRERAVGELTLLGREFSKLQFPRQFAAHFMKPPASPEECVFAQTTTCVSADLATRITPCQFGGDPDCSQCGCYASMALAAVGSYRIGGLIPASAILNLSQRIGKARHPNPGKIVDNHAATRIRERDLTRIVS